MDPLTAIAVTSSFVVFVQAIARATDLVRILQTNADPRTKEVWAQLLVQKVLLQEWQRQMGVKTTEDVQLLARKLAPQNQEVLAKLWRETTAWMNEAERVFKKYGFSLASGEQHDDGKRITQFGTRAKRVKWAIQGQEELFAIVKTLEALNTALAKIAPPPPGYYLEPLYPTRDNSISSLRQEDREQESTMGLSVQDQITSESAAVPIEASQKVFIPTLQLLYKHCLEGVSSLAWHAPNCGFDTVRSSLKVWGSGLFGSDTVVNLDSLLALAMFRSMRQHVEGILADMTSILGEWHLNKESSSAFQLLRILVCACSVPEISALSKVRSQLVVILGFDEIAEAVIDDELDHGPDAAELNDRYLKRCAESIMDLVECLNEVSTTLLAMSRLADYRRVLIKRAEEPVSLGFGLKGTYVQQQLVEESQDQISPTLKLLNMEVEWATAMANSMATVDVERTVSKIKEDEHKRWLEQVRRLRFYGDSVAKACNNEDPDSQRRMEPVLACLTQIAAVFGE